MDNYVEYINHLKSKHNLKFTGGGDLNDTFTINFDKYNIKPIITFNPKDNNKSEEHMGTIAPNFELKFIVNDLINIEYYISFTINKNTNKFKDIFKTVIVKQNISRGTDEILSECIDCLNYINNKDKYKDTNYHAIKSEYIKNILHTFVDKNGFIDFNNYTTANIINDDNIDIIKYCDNEVIQLLHNIIEENHDRLIELIAINFYYLSCVYYIIFQIWITINLYILKTYSKDLLYDTLPTCGNLMLNYAIQNTMNVYDAIDKYYNMDILNIKLQTVFDWFSNSLLVPATLKDNVGDCWLNSITLAYHYYNNQVHKINDHYNRLYEGIKYLYDNNSMNTYINENTMFIILFYKSAVEDMRAYLVTKYLIYKYIKHNKINDENKKKDKNENINFNKLFNNNSLLLRNLLPHYDEISNYIQCIHAIGGPHDVFKIKKQIDGKDTVFIYDLNSLQSSKITVTSINDYVNRDSEYDIDPDIIDNNASINEMYGNNLDTYIIDDITPINKESTTNTIMNEICKKILSNYETIDPAEYIAHKKGDNFYLKIKKIIDDLKINYESNQYKYDLEDYIKYYEKDNIIKNTLDEYNMFEKIYRYLKHTMILPKSKNIITNINNEYVKYKNQYNIIIEEYDDAFKLYTDIQNNNPIDQNNYSSIINSTGEYNINYCESIFIMFLPVFISKILLNDNINIPYNDVQLDNDKYLLLYEANYDNRSFYMFSTSNDSKLPCIRKSFYDKTQIVYNAGRFTAKFECYKEFAIIRMENNNYYLFNYGKIIVSKHTIHKKYEYPILTDTSYLDYNWCETYLCMIIESCISKFNHCTPQKIDNYKGFNLFVERSPINVYKIRSIIHIEKFDLHNTINILNINKWSYGLYFSAILPIEMNKNFKALVTNKAIAQKPKYQLGGEDYIYSKLNIMFILLLLIIIVVIIIIVVVIIKLVKRRSKNK